MCNAVFIKEAYVGIWYYHFYFKWLKLIICNLIKWSKKYKHQTGDTLLRQFYLGFKSNRQKIPRYKKKLNLFSVKKKGNYMSYGIGKTKKNGKNGGLGSSKGISYEDSAPTKLLNIKQKPQQNYVTKVFYRNYHDAWVVIVYYDTQNYCMMLWCYD